MFARLKNRYLTQKRDQAIEDLSSCFVRCYCGDDFFAADRTMAFYDDEKFQSVLDKHAKGGPYPGMAWRLHVLFWAIEKALKVEGALCEFGTFRGFKMNCVVDYFGEALSQRDVYLFDTFEGVDPKQRDGSPIEPEEHQKVGLYDFVQNRFSSYKNVQIVKGAAPHSLSQVAPLGQVAFMHLDMNSYQAEIGVLDALWDSMPKGAVVILDDYGLNTHRAQMEHELPWFKEKGYTPLELPTAQAIIVK